MELIPIMDDQDRGEPIPVLSAPFPKRHYMASTALSGPSCLGLVTGLVLAAGISGYGSEAFAVPAWQYSANTNAAFTLTDNVSMDAADTRSDFITSLVGGVQVTSATRAGTINFNYQASYDHYIDTDNLNGVRHNLMTRNNFVLVDGLMFLDVKGSIGERSSSQSLRTPGTNRTMNNDKTIVLTSSISPYIDTTLKDRVGVTARIEYSQVNYRKPGVSSDAQQREGKSHWNSSFAIKSLDQDQRLRWEITGKAATDDDDLERLSGGGVLKLRLRENARLLARGGYDSTSGRRNGEDIEREYWRVGFEMEPVRNSVIRLEAGERYNGSSYDALIRYTVSRALDITAKYEQKLQTDQNRFVDFLNAWEPTPTTVGIRLIDPNSPYFGLDLDGQLIDDLIVNETASLRLTGSLGHLSYSLSAKYRTRDFAEIQGVGGPYQDETSSVSLNLSRSFGQRTSGNLNAQYSDQESDLPLVGLGVQAIDFSREIDRTSVQLSATYALSPTARTQLSYRHSLRESGEGVSVEENVVMLTVTKSW